MFLMTLMPRVSYISKKSYNVLVFVARPVRGFTRAQWLQEQEQVLGPFLCLPLISQTSYGRDRATLFSGRPFPSLSLKIYYTFPGKSEQTTACDIWPTRDGGGRKKKPRKGTGKPAPGTNYNPVSCQTPLGGAFIFLADRRVPKYQLFPSIAGPI